MEYDNDYILKHIKKISRTKFTVYITEPLEMQQIVAPLPYYPGQVIRVAKEIDGKWELTEHGWWLAGNAI